MKFKLFNLLKKPKVKRSIIEEDMHTYGVAFEKILDAKPALHDKVERLEKLKQYVQDRREKASKTITDKKQLDEYDALIHKIELSLAFSKRMKKLE